MIIGSCFTGKFLDHDYQTIKQEMIRTLESDPEKYPSGMTPADVTKEEYFPIERARLRTMPYYLALFIACTIGYGWCLHQKVSIAGPLILQIASTSECCLCHSRYTDFTFDYSRICIPVGHEHDPDFDH